MKGANQKRYIPSLAFSLHMEKRRKLVKKVGRQRYKEALARHKRMNPVLNLFERTINKIKSLVIGSLRKIKGLFQRQPKWKTITFRTHAPRTLSPEERADRIAHRKQVSHNRQRLINKRGWA